ncbi:MAG TPA: hypothetical protein VHG51_00615, partial [Longimicrobiaceae bacterium]|nr:hypothetical protein [Longimicrobiaceae bacterium]
MEVVHVLFGSLRHRYAAAGIRAGARLRLRCRTAERLLVELPGGAMAEVDAVHAPFVEARPPPREAAAPPRTGRAPRPPRPRRRRAAPPAAAPRSGSGG